MYIMFSMWQPIFSSVHKCHNRSIAEYFCLSEVLGDFFSISKNLHVLYEHKEKRILPFEKRDCVSKVWKNVHKMHTVPSGQWAAAAVLPFSHSREQARIAGMLLQVFCITVCGLSMPLGEECLAVQEPLHHEQLGKVKWKASDCAHPR